MATRIEKQMPNGETAVFYTKDGFTMPEDSVMTRLPAKDLGLQLEWIRDTDIRKDDVIICGFPKTGTHWTWEIANMIQRETADYHKDTKRSAMLDFNTPEMTSAITSPRVLNTHFTHNLMPTGIKEKRCKILHLLRNPKDVAVSLYFHLKNLDRFNPPPFNEFAKVFRTDVAAYCPYLWYVKHWEQFQKDNPDYPVLNVFYEDMQHDLASEVKRIATFLGKDLHDKTIEEISQKCTFNSMKEADQSKNKVGQDANKVKSFIYRKGIVGDWKNYLTVAENEAYDKWIEDEMKDSKIKFKFE